MEFAIGLILIVVSAVEMLGIIELVGRNSPH